MGRMSTNQQEWSAQDRITIYRLWSMAAVLWAGAIALPFIAEATGIPFGSVLVLATAVIAAWTVWVIIQSLRTESAHRVRELRMRHMLVWATTVVAYLLAGFIAMFVSGGGPVLAVWSFTAIMTLGWVALTARLNQLASRA